jgi:RNA polymerase sigma-70 factor, ECF subfamily
MNAEHRRFQTQVMPHLDAAYRLAMALARSRADAEDLVQESLLRAFRGIHGLRDTEAKAWLLAIVRNCFFTSRARQQKRATISVPATTTELEEVEIASDLEPESVSLGEERKRELGDALAKLSAEHREILLLREVADMSYREIAAIANLPIGTVMSRLARARLTLRETWVAEHGEDQP